MEIEIEKLSNIYTYIYMYIYIYIYIYIYYILVMANKVKVLNVRSIIEYYSEGPP